MVCIWNALLLHSEHGDFFWYLLELLHCLFANTACIHYVYLNCYLLILCEHSNRWFLSSYMLLCCELLKKLLTAQLLNAQWSMDQNLQPLIYNGNISIHKWKFSRRTRTSEKQNKRLYPLKVNLLYPLKVNWLYPLKVNWLVTHSLAKLKWTTFKYLVLCKTRA